MIERLRHRFWKSAPLEIPAFGGGMMEPVVSPFRHHVAISRITGIALMVRTATVLLMVLNLILALFAVAVMRSSVHIADGSRFGCIVAPLEDQMAAQRASAGSGQ